MKRTIRNSIHLFLIFVGGGLFSGLKAEQGQHQSASAHQEQEAASKQHQQTLCGVGKSQSPVNLENTIDTKLDELRFEYKSTRLDMQHTTHGLKLNYPSGSFLYVGNVEYELQHMYFVSPSEHAIEGEYSAVELQLFHKARNGKKVVVAILFDEGGVKQTLDVIWRNMPVEKDKHHFVNRRSINAVDYIGEKQNYYFYTGSMSQAPCEEGVSWFVMQEKNALTKIQVNKFQRFFNKHTRKVNTLHNRSIRLAVFGNQHRIRVDSTQTKEQYKTVDAKHETTHHE